MCPSSAVLKLIATLLTVTAQVDFVSADDNDDSRRKKGVLNARQETFVGVFTEPLSGALAAQLSEILGRGQGLLVTGLVSDSPAEKAGIKKNDVLVTYDGRKLLNPSQLRLLVVGSKSGRVVRIQVVRRAKLQSLEVTLTERTVLMNTVLMNLVTGSPRVFKYPSSLLKNDRRETVIIGGKLKKSGTKVRPGEAIPPKPDGSVKQQSESGIVHKQSIAITSDDGKQYLVEVLLTGSLGKTKSQTLQGDPGELRRQLDKLPAEIREPVRKSLDRINVEGKRRRGFRLQLRPGIDGTGRHLHLRLRQPGDDGAIRILELDLSSQREIKIDDLLQVEILQEELQRLPAKMRDRVKSTLRQTRISGIRRKIERSQ